jgi:hypothetical protein
MGVKNRMIVHAVDQHQVGGAGQGARLSPVDRDGARLRVVVKRVALRGAGGLRAHGAERQTEDVAGLRRQVVQTDRLDHVAPVGCLRFHQRAGLAHGHRLRNRSQSEFEINRRV